MILERHTIHVSDDAGRIAMLEKRTIGTDDSLPTLTRYVYSNHLQSASLELDEYAAIVSYEEYHPYSTTAFQAKSATINAVAKRYRYTGKERDEESGLYYHGARYYIPWLCRWTAIDPMESKYAGMSPYNYSFNNPIIWNDLSGMQPGDPPKEGDVKLDSYGQTLKYFAGDWASEGGELDNVTVIGDKPIAAVTDGALAHYGRLSSVQYIEKLETDHNTVMSMRKFKAQQQMEEQIRLNQRHIGYDWRTGKDFNISIQQIKDAEYQKNEAGGEAIRNGTFAAITSLSYSAFGLDSMRGALVGSVLDGVAMSFAGVGTPYGKTEAITQIYETNKKVQRPIEIRQPVPLPKIPETEVSILETEYGVQFSFPKVGDRPGMEIYARPRPNGRHLEMEVDIIPQDVLNGDITLDQAHKLYKNKIGIMTFRNTLMNWAKEKGYSSVRFHGIRATGVRADNFQSSKIFNLK